MRRFMWQPRSRRQPRSVQTASVVVGAALLIAMCSAGPILSAPIESTRVASTPATASSALKPIDQPGLQSMIDATARELLVPGAVVSSAHTAS
jgi:hypothetical protein